MLTRLYNGKVIRKKWMRKENEFLAVCESVQIFVGICLLNSGMRNENGGTRIAKFSSLYV